MEFAGVFSTVCEQQNVAILLRVSQQAAAPKYMEDFKNFSWAHRESARH